jgi:hypothetical protein
MVIKSGDGWIAEIDVNGFGLRLVCLETGAGIAVNVYSYKDQRWADAPVWVRTYDEGKSMAANRAQRVLTAHGNLKLPNVDWKKAGSEPPDLWTPPPEKTPA